MAEMGRPKIKVDWNEVDKLCALHCTRDEVSSFLGISNDTLERHIKEEHGLTFAAYFALKAGMGKISLRRRQWKLAEKNAAMAIFLGKNLLGQTDRNEVHNINTEFQMSYSLADEIEESVEVDDEGIDS